jgi:CRP/FNR family transcriptional regulator
MSSLEQLSPERPAAFIASHAFEFTAPHTAPAGAPHDAHCSNCGTRNLCMPSGLSAEHCERLDRMIGVSRRVTCGETVYRAGDPFRNLYAIKAGSFKSVVVLHDGREQITGFQLTGELLGMDGVGSDLHTCDAVALEDSTLCMIPFQLLEAFCQEVPAMQRHVHRLMCSEITRESGQLTLLGSMCAEERVASFLLNLSLRLQARGYSAHEFQLRMKREEIGSYLGMKLETVSRVLSKFQKRDLIDVQGRLIRILDAEGLRGASA